MMRICILSNSAGECGRGDADLVRERHRLVRSFCPRKKQATNFGWKITHFCYISQKYSHTEKGQFTLKTTKETRYNMATQYNRHKRKLRRFQTPKSTDNHNTIALTIFKKGKVMGVSLKQKSSSIFWIEEKEQMFLHLKIHS